MIGTVSGVADLLVGLDDAGLDDRIRSLELLQRRTTAEQALAIAVAEARALHVADGHHSMKGYLRATLNCSTAETARLRRLAKLVDAHPEVASRLLDGRLGVAQAHELARAFANPRCGEQLVDVLPVLLEQAEVLSFDDFRTCVRRWETLADLDGAWRDRERSVSNRNATAVSAGAGVDVRVSGGDPVTAAELIATLEAFTEAEFQADLAARRAEHGDDAAGQPLPRTAAQRRFDAVVEIFRRAAGAPPGAGRRVSPTVNIMMDERTCAETLVRHGLAPDSALDEVADPGLAARRCETAAGVPVHPDDALAAMIWGHVRRVIVDSAGVVTRMGRRRRLFTGAVREAAQMNARRCGHPGCTVPGHLAQVDHIHEHRRGGRTDSTNGWPDCSRHNLLKNLGFRTERDPRGGLVTYRPDGTAMLAAGRRRPLPGGWLVQSIGLGQLGPLDLPPPGQPGQPDDPTPPG